MKKLKGSETEKNLLKAFETIPLKFPHARKYRQDMMLYLTDMIRSYELLHKQAIYKSSSHLTELYKEMPYLNKDSVKQDIRRFIYNDAQCRYDSHIFTTLPQEVGNKYLSDYNAKLKELGISEKPKELGE